MIDLFTDIRKTLVLSVGVHLLLLILFIFTKTGFDFNTSGFTEVSFIASSPTRASTPAPAPKTVVQQQQPETPPEVTQEEQPEAQQPKPADAGGADLAEVPVNLPTRRMREDETDVLRNRQTDKLSTDQGQAEAPYRYDQSESKEPGVVTPDRATGDKITASPQQLSVSDRGISPTTEVGSPAEMQPFTIEGKAAERTIVNKVIPEYPENLQKEAIIKIRFTVLPDGRVGQMIPVQKDDPKLEDITILAMKQWRFNALPPGAEQNSVQGVITFRYILR